MPRSRPAFLLAGVLGVVALGPSACAGSSGGTADGGPTVVVTSYSMQYLAERVAGDAADVVNLAPAGTEPHDLELAPASVARLTSAEVVLTVGGFQAAVDDAVAQGGDDQTVVDATDVVDLLTSGADGHDADDPSDDAPEDGTGDERGSEDRGHDHGGVDPHFWLDPQRLADVGDAFAAAMADVDPDAATTYTANAASLRADLDALDEQMSDGLADCADRSFVTSHQSFAYLADAFDLHQIGISGIDPEGEPSPARVAQVLTQARDDGVTTVFTQPGGLTAGADVVADELGVTLATLDPVELQPRGSDYRGAMEANLAALQEGLGCR